MNLSTLWFNAVVVKCLGCLFDLDVKPGVWQLCECGTWTLVSEDSST